MSKKKRKAGIAKSIDWENNAIYRKVFWIIPLVTFFVYISIIGQEFVNYDDDWMIYDNTYVTDFNPEKAKLLFTEFYQGQYSPVSMALIATAYTIGSGKPIALKLTGLLLHLISIILIFRLFSVMTGNLRLALLSAAFFALHPVQVEAVAWVSASIKIGTYAVFTLAGLIFWVKYLRDEKISFYLLSLFFMILSCFSKEQAFVFPLYLILITYSMKNEIFIKKRILELIPFGLVAILFLVITYFAVNSNIQVQLNQFSLTEKLLLMSYSFVAYLKLMLFPVNLAPFYNAPETINSIKGLLLYPIITFAIIAIILWSIKRSKILLFGISFFLISIALTYALQIISIRDSLIYDRYLYLGLPGFIIAVMAGAEIMFKRKLSVIFLLVLAIFSVASFQRVKVFQTSETLWTDAINKKYNNPLAYNNRGHYYRLNNNIQKALADYNQALSINPNYYLALNNRGKIYFDQGQIGLALEDFNKSLSVSPDYVGALNNRGAAHAANDDLVAALTDLNRAIELKQNNLDALLNRTLVFSYSNQFENAIADATAYLKLKPDDADMLNIRSLAYNRLDRDAESLTDLDRAIELLPSQGIFWRNRSYFFNKMGNIPDALRDIKQAQSLGTEVSQDYIHMLQRQM